MSYLPLERPRVPREPEAVHFLKPSSLNDKNSVLMRPRARQDPPEFSFSQSQLSILAKRQMGQQQEPGAFMLPQQSTGKPHMPRDPSVVDERLARTPLRTPNPIARSDISGTKVSSHQHQLLQSVLQKASSTLSDTNGAGDEVAAGKRSLKKVLAQQLLRKKPHASQPSPRHKTDSRSSPTASSPSSTLSPGLAAFAVGSKPTTNGLMGSPSSRQNVGASDEHKKSSSYSIRERLRRARTPTKARSDPAQGPSAGEAIPATLLPVAASTHATENLPRQKDKIHTHRELKLKDHVKLARSLDDEETRDRVQQIVAKHFAQKHLQQKTTVPPLRHGVVDYDEITNKSKERDPEGYSDFFRLLQGEVSGQHVQLWTSFQAAFDKSLSLAPPPLQESISMPKPTRFDAKTSKILKKLHFHTLKQANVDCVGRSQLVNDKAFLKEVRQLPSLALSTSEDEPKSPSSGTSDPVIQVRSTDDTIATSASGLSPALYQESYRGHDKNDAILSTRSNSSDDTSFRRSHLKDSLLGRQEKMSMTANESVETQNPKHSAGSPSSSSSFSWTSIQLRPSRNLPSTSSTGNSCRSPLSSPAGTDFKASASVPEWKSLQLRKVLVDNSNRGSEVEPADSSSKVCTAIAISESGVSDLSEFGKLLRPARPSAMKNDTSLDEPKQVLEGDSVVYERPVLLAASLSVDENSIDPKSHTLEATSPGGQETTSSVVAFSQLSAEETTSFTVSPSLASSTVPKETIADPKQIIDDEAIMIRILGTPEGPVQGNESAWILVGKQMMMVVRKTGVIGDNSAQVLWKVPRSDVPSLSLNMATLQVTLVCSGSGSCEKVLQFETSDDCLKFANAFYEHGKKLEDQAIEAMVPDSKAATSTPIDINVTLASVTISDSSDQSLSADGESFRLESLTDEEQTLLETYRQLRRTKGAKVALDEMIAAEEQSKVGSLMAHRSLAANCEAAKKDAPNPIDTIPPGSTLPRFVSTSGEASSPVSLLSHSIALSECELAQVETYKRMLCQRKSLEEVRLKMEQNHVDPKVMALVVSSDTSGVNVTEGSELTADEEQIASSYRTMVKLRFPVEVIKHRMKKEEVSAKIVAAVLGNTENITASDASYAEALTAAEEAVAATYRKMLQLGIEKDAVRHKMIKEEVDEKIMEAVVGKELPSSAPLNSTTRSYATSEGRKEKNRPTLSAEEESVASNYRKMLKIQVPKDMVLSRMQQDGVSANIIAAVIGQQSINDAPDVSKEGATSGNKLVSLHWTPLSGKELDNSIWKVNSMLEDLDAHPERSDVSKLVELFQKKTNQGRKKEKGPESDSSTTGRARLLDLTRSNNIAISLKAFKDFSYKDLAELISFLDPLRKVTGERVLFLRDLLPTAAELDTIRSFEGPDDRLLPAELWFRHVQHIKRIDTKVQVMRTMETFHSEIESLRGNFQLLGRVCHQVMESDKLVFLLGKVLRIGNIMNEGTRSGGAAGFKFDSLLRLTQTKSADNKVTVLDFLVTSLVDQGQRDMLDLLSDFPECQTASRLAIADLLNAAKDLKEGLNRCEEELRHLEDDASGKTIAKKKKNGSETGSGFSAASLAPNAALLNAILSRGKSCASFPKQEGFAQRDKFLAAIKERSTPSQQGTSTDTPTVPTAAPASVDSTETKNSLNGGVSRLKMFLLDANRLLDDLETIKGDALRACTGLARYCGENGGTNSTSSLLGILATFATNLHDALKKYDDKLEADSRKQRRKGDDSSTLCSDSATGSTIKSDESAKTNGKSLVLMVSDMLKLANERTKEDFKKGRTYDNPSSTLKAIYELERATAGAPSTSRSSVSPTGKSIRKLDIVSAIREQEANVNDDDMLQARSRFGEVKLPKDVAAKNRKVVSDVHHSVEPVRDREQSANGKVEEFLQASSRFGYATKSMDALSEDPSSHGKSTVANEAVTDVTISVKQARALFEEKLSSPIMPRPQMIPQPPLNALGRVLGERRDKEHDQQTNHSTLVPVSTECTKSSPNFLGKPKDSRQDSSTRTTTVNIALPPSPPSDDADCREENHEDGIIIADPAKVERILLSKDVSVVHPQAKEPESALYYVPLTDFPKPALAPAMECDQSSADDVDQKDGGDAVTSDKAEGRSEDGAVLVDCDLEPSLTSHPTPKSTEKDKGSPALRLSEARKARVLFEKMVGRSPPPPVMPMRKSLSCMSSGGGQHTTASEPRCAASSTPSPTMERVTGPNIDLSGPQSRLRTKESSSTQPSQRLSLSYEDRESNASRLSAVAHQSPQQSAFTDLEHTPPTRSQLIGSPTVPNPKEPQPRKSLLEMAREKRVSRDPNSHVTPAAAAAPTTPLRTSQGSNLESPVLQLARQKREAKKEGLLLLP